MAEGRPVYQPPFRTSGVDAVDGRYRGPLLPYEKQLIEIAGCSEEEYRRFVYLARERARVRPAEYDNIPDIQAAEAVWIPIVISLVLGAASTAAAYFLAPKPSAPNIQAQDTRTLTLDSINGNQRFSPTHGFNSQAELANYGDPIPIVFGRWTGTTGGLLVTPKLVWSRMFSYGSQQGVKMLFVVGEQGVADFIAPDGIDPPPALPGIFVGNGVLDAIYEQSFAFYWKRNTTASNFYRMQAVNLTYGTRGSLASGDPENNNDIFTCPVGAQLDSPAFCAAHSLSNNAEFGCYAPIANGSNYRVNWRVIPIPHLQGQRDDPGENLTYERVKIAGSRNDTGFTNEGDDGGGYKSVRPLGMSGTGRNYSRRMGITHLNDVEVPESAGTQIRPVSREDIIVFTIDGGKIPEGYYKGPNREISVDDINDATEEMRNAADDALQVGEIVMIGRTTWQVISRDLAIWRLGSTQKIRLKCIDISLAGVKNIGLVSNGMLTRDYLSDSEDQAASNQYNAGAAFFPLMKVAKAVVRNTRSCNATEIGIRSNVYQRINGLCNFQTIPSPEQLKNLESQRISITTGTVNAVITRSSIFTIYLRPAGTNSSGNEFTWQPLGEEFCIIGNEPKEQYNFIRIEHPDKRQYEFKLVPINGTDFGQNFSDEESLWHLHHGVDKTASRQELVSTYSNIYGSFKVNSVGQIVKKREIKGNNEFMTKPAETQITTQTPQPSNVGILDYLPNDGAFLDRTLSAVEWLDWFTNATFDYAPIGGRAGSFTWELTRLAGIGSADDYPGNAGTRVTFEYKHDLTGGRWYIMRYTLNKSQLSETNSHFSGQIYGWVIEQENVVSASNNWEGLGQFIATFNTINSNPFRSPPNAPLISTIGRKYRVSGVITRDSSSGRRQGYYREAFGNANNYARGYLQTYDINWSSQMVVRLKSTVVDAAGNFGQSNQWTDPIIEIASVGGGFNLQRGDLYTDSKTVSGSNPYRIPGSTVGVRLVLESLSAAISRNIVYPGRVFEFQSQYADISLYGNLVEKSNASNPEHSVVYVNEIVRNEEAPLYDRMTIAGLAIKASRNFTNLDQVRFWLKNGIPVKHLHPGDNNEIGPSNLFTDLVYYLLTDRVAGVGNTLNMSHDNAPLIDSDQMATTCKFLRANKLFFDGIIGSSINVRQFIADTAPFMLCNFAITDGKFALVPALPANMNGSISTSPITIKQLFTAGNIIEDSFELTYLTAEQRKDFQAAMRFREERENQLTAEKNIVVRWKEANSSSYPLEQFDMLQYCTSQQHAELVARFFMSVRRRITHTIQFKTTPYGMDLAPGDYVRVVTESNPYSSAQNGSIGATGVITSATEFTDGQYRILSYGPSSDETRESIMTVSGGIVQDSSLYNNVFTVLTSTVSQNVYMIEQLTLDNEGTVLVSASEFPCDDQLVSLIAKDVTNSAQFEVEG